ncbi:MAG: DUF1579 family protein [Terriglobia bacterium]|jgi:hypothetical protein
MQRISVLLLLLVACFSTVMRAQAPAPKPDPALKKLSVYQGHWTCEEESKAGPLGPGGKVTSEESFQMILGGFFQQHRATDKGPTGGQSLEIAGYDPVNKNLHFSGYSNDGSTWSGVLSVNGNTLTSAGKGVVGGNQGLFRGADVFAPDLMSRTGKVEISTDDGKTWIPFIEGKCTKVKLAPKK